MVISSSAFEAQQAVFDEKLERLKREEAS